MEDPDFIADAAFQRVVYGSHPYGHPESGTLTSIPAITRAHLTRFHQTYYAPNISALAIVGDLPATESFALAEQWFGSWKARDIPPLNQTAAPDLEGRQIFVIDKPDAVQTEIRVGSLSVPRKDPEYFNVLLGSLILGGSAQSRLNRTLRVERGLTYGAYATIVPRKGPGSFYSVTETRTDKTREALDLIFSEVDKMGVTEVPAEELRDAKTYIIGGFPLTIELPSDLATRLTTVFLYELGDDYLATYRDRLAGVSAADILRVAQQAISSGGTRVVLVGNAQEFRETLEGLGTVQMIAAADLDLDSPSLGTAR
jgi:zinc protease